MRRLFYHAESDSHLEVHSDSGFNGLHGGEPVDDVTGDPEHEAAYLEECRGRCAVKHDRPVFLDYAGGKGAVICATCEQQIKGSKILTFDEMTAALALIKSQDGKLKREK